MKSTGKSNQDNFLKVMIFRHPDDYSSNIQIIFSIR